MRGDDQQTAHLFSYLSPEQRVPVSNPMPALCDSGTLKMIRDESGAGCHRRLQVVDVHGETPRRSARRVRPGQRTRAEQLSLRATQHLR